VLENTVEYQKPKSLHSRKNPETKTKASTLLAPKANSHLEINTSTARNAPIERKSKEKALG
jgi:hypothetical protein